MEQEFAIEELSERHRPAVVALCRAALDLPEDAAEAEQIVTRLHGPVVPDHPSGVGPRQTIGLVAVVDETVRGVVLGSVAHRDPSVGHVDLIAVDPQWRRQGLGRALLGRAESALAARGAGEVLLAGNPPYYAWPGVDVRYTPAVCLAMALGYLQDRTAWNMTADLASAGSPALRDTADAQRRLAQAGITVRRADGDDVAALVAFTQATFGDAWAAEVAHSVGRPDAGCHLAVRTGDPGEVLGFAAYGSSRPSWFGPMGTAPTAQGLGIGAILLRRCLRDLAEAGHQRVEIGWVGPVPFYASAAGARIERVFFLYRKQL
ncbi:GNAT family N-acetyltransferase [Solwaraspora sp. WMMD792]|uniref:GNAT family N-acetyltransferase n=1 Tax=Solwaraspora sp. WMMD792 TaxID=3016099 RepID=UPI0024176921|nr:GNAT family N-acetyltransferase [Solwaraspora sp. WMMD792]MDG4773265.1 GNAT family N-acetyltransferase [Solwaraspora sp. WMMD792]